MGIDNNSRKKFFGKDGDIDWVKKDLKKSYKNYNHQNIDIRNYSALEKIFRKYKKSINEIFTGILVASGKALKELVPLIDNKNAAKEYYLTDLISIASEKGFKINALDSPNNETKGANNRFEQEELERVLRNMNADDLLNAGATLVDKTRVDIRGNVKVGADCTIDVNVIFEGDIELGDNVEIGANSVICDTKIDNGTKILPFSPPNR